MGKLLLPLSCQKTLPSAGWLDCATALVPPREAMEEHRLEALSDETAAGRGVQAGRPRLSDTVASGCAKPIHESWMRENCTSSLSGGRRLARRQLSAPPPTRQNPSSSSHMPSGPAPFIARPIQRNCSANFVARSS